MKLANIKTKYEAEIKAGAQATLKAQNEKSAADALLVAEKEAGKQAKLFAVAEKNAAVHKLMAGHAAELMIQYEKGCHFVQKLLSAPK